MDRQTHSEPEDTTGWSPAGGSPAGTSRPLADLALVEVVDGLLDGSPATYVRQGGQDVLWDRLKTLTGLDEAWRAMCLSATEKVAARDVAFAVAGWALCVEYVDDLRRAPVQALLRTMAELPAGVRDACRTLAAHLRERHPAFYRRTADETETFLPAEIENARAEELGGVDTFRFEEANLLADALGALEARRWDEAAAWARQRLDGHSFWLVEVPARRSAWEIVHGVASLGRALAAAGPRLEAPGGLDSALERYVGAGASVDRAHRVLEQLRATLFDTLLPESERLLSVLLEIRATWREWADNWTRDFNALCQRAGFLPDSKLRQRHLFEDVVRPRTQEPGTTALLVVDALRFEMAQELAEAMSDMPDTGLCLDACFAELPSVTSVGMNALAPVSQQGMLKPLTAGGRIRGFYVDRQRITKPEARQELMHQRIGGAACPWFRLQEVLERDDADLRREIAETNLVVVYGREIDEAGGRGVGASVFDAVLQKIRAVWHRLHNAGVRRFVVTSDHGFLMFDESTHFARSHGREVGPGRRHVMAATANGYEGEVCVDLADLDYEGVEGCLTFPETTAVFDVGNRLTSFVNGGNSLQERVVPVLTVAHRSLPAGDARRYSLEAAAEEDVAGMQAFRGRLTLSDADGLDDARQEVELALRVPEQPRVRVELCQKRGGARLIAGAVVVKVGEAFEVFFRLRAAAGVQVEERVLVEIYHPSGEVKLSPSVLDKRFPVEAATSKAPAEYEALPTAGESVPAAWLDQLPEGGVRRFFEHLAKHDAANEEEASRLLGGPRELRKFSRNLERWAAIAPFDVRIHAANGTQNYVRE